MYQHVSTAVSALFARSAVGHKSASTVVSALSARSAVGVQSASTVVSTFDARSAGRPNDIGRLVKRRPNRDSGIAPRFIVNFYQLYRLLDRAPWVKNGKKSSIVVVSLAPLLLPCPPLLLPPLTVSQSHSLCLASSSWQHHVHSGGLPPTTGRNGIRVDTPQRLHGPSQTRTCLRRSVSRRSSVGTQPVRVGTENVLLS